MKLLHWTAVLILATAVVACSSGESKSEPALRSDIDTVSYIVGMNIGRNLQGMDSMLNVDVVCMGIADAYADKAKFSDEEARLYYMKYMNFDVYERVKRYEKRFIADLCERDRKYNVTASGLAYKIASTGNNSRRIRNNRDTVNLCFRALDNSGRVVDTTFYRHDTLRIAVGQMPRGVQEASKLIGEGGHIEAWLPSTLAFGSAGCDSLDVAPNTMLYYDIYLLNIERR